MTKCYLHFDTPSFYRFIKKLSFFVKTKIDCLALKTKAVCWESILEFGKY